MPLDLPPLTIEDVRQTKWQEALGDGNERTCFSYIAVLNKRGTEAEARGDRNAEGVFRLLSSVASFSLRSDNSEPFGSGASGPGWRLPQLTDLTEEHLRLIREMHDETPDSEMRARLADVLWVAKKDHKAGNAAIDAYLESATRLEDHAKWVDAFERIERAASLARSLKSRVDAVTAHIDRILDESRSVHQPSYFAAKLLALMFELRLGDADRNALFAEFHAELCERASEWDKAEHYFALAGQWRIRMRESAQAKALQIRAAESRVKMSEAAASHGVAAHHLERAIEAFRRLGEKQRADELHRQMLERQKQSRAEFAEVSVPFDGTEMVKRARAAVAGKELFDAIFALCSLAIPPRVADLRKEVEESSKKFLFMHLFPAAILSAEGKVIARHGAVTTNLQPEDQDPTVAHMYRNANFHRHIAASAAIEPARNEIWDSTHVRERDFYALLFNNPFVPAGREHLFARGLYAGMSGDYAVALHMLMPQLEHAVRKLMEAHGVIISSLKDGIQQEKDLNSLLRDPQIEKVFDEDLLFELRGILISRFGSNLRNMMAHGLLDAADCYSTQVCYFWWMTLRFVCHPILVARAGQAKTKTKRSGGKRAASPAAKKRGGKPAAPPAGRPKNKTRKRGGGSSR